MDSSTRLAALRTLVALPALLFLPLVIATLLVPLRARVLRLTSSPRRSPD